MRLREPGDLPPGRDAADPGQVEDDEVDGARLQQGAKRVEMIEMLPGGDRHFEPAAKIGESGHVGVVNRILQPRDAGVLQDATRPSRSGQRPALDGVDHDANVRPDGVAHGLHAASLHLGSGFFADPQLHRAESVGHVLLRGGGELARGETDPQAVARVRREPIAKAPEEPMQRLTQGLAVGVPDRDVERRERAVQQPARAHPVAAPRELFPGRLRLEHAHADQMLTELARRGPDRRHQIGARVDDVADALDSVRRGDAGQHVPVRVDRAAAGGVGTLDRNPNHLDRDLRDLQGVRPQSERTRSLTM